MIKQFTTICLLLLASNIALAHPHNWISLKTEFILNDKNQLSEIKQHWEFDAIYSMITSANLKNAYDNEEMGLALMADQMQLNLERQNFFSNLIIDGKEVKLPVPNGSKLDLESKPPISVMTYHLNFRFKSPIDITDHKLVWSVFDPTYYIAMNHKSVEDIIISGGNSAECGKELVTPTPSAETQAYANSLDKSQRDSDGLGNQFSERAIIQCI